MEEALQKLIEAHELNVAKYTALRDERNAQIKFMSEHDFMRELEHLQTQKEAFTDIFYDYRGFVEDLKNILNAWNS